MRTMKLAPVLVLALVLGACGNGEEETAAPGGEFAAYCAATVKIETVEEPDIDFESLSPAQQAEAAKTFTRETIRPLADAIVPLAPAAIKDDIDVLYNAVKEVERTGNFEVFEKPEVHAASLSSHRFDLANCGWQRSDVTAAEYQFRGLPKELKPGVTSLQLKSEGKEPHEMALFRINDDVAEPFADILKLPEKEAMTKGKHVGGTFVAETGDEDYFVVNLTPGRYGVACFVPVGGKEDGPPHFTRGMLAEFTVA